MTVKIERQYMFTRLATRPNSLGFQNYSLISILLHTIRLLTAVSSRRCIINEANDRVNSCGRQLAQCLDNIFEWPIKYHIPSYFWSIRKACQADELKNDDLHANIFFNTLKKKNSKSCGIRTVWARVMMHSFMDKISFAKISSANLS